MKTILAVVLILATALPGLAQDTPKKAPVPAEAAQAEATKLIKEVYGDEWAKAKTATEKQALAKKLLGKASESKDDPASHFVLLRVAKDVATQAGDGQTAFQVIDAMADVFQVDVLGMKAAVLTKLAAALKPAQHKSISEEALKLLDQAISQDNFKIADELGKLALAEARKAREKELIAQAQGRIAEIARLVKAYEDVKVANVVLEKTPDDPKANLVVGKYLCLVKGDWEKGVPMLALGKDEALKLMAQQELEGAASSTEQVKLGDGWWDLAEKQKGTSKKLVQGRAGYWYQKALPSLSGLMKDKLEKRLAQVTEEPSPEDDAPAARSRPPLAVAPFDEKTAKRHQARWAKFLRVPVVQSNSIGMKLVLIPPGEFMMGSAKELIEEELRLHGGDGWYWDRPPGEGPQHRVRITKPYWLGATDVTQEEYQRVIGSNPSKFQGDPQRPVEMVSWDEAVEFCRKLSELPGEKAARRRYGLPTEAQWEHACRAGTTTRRYSGDDEAGLVDVAWFKTNAGGQTHPVGQKRANAWGLYDMYGNVWEWCQDRYGKEYYMNAPTDDPSGPPGGSHRVYRGGSWRYSAWFCRSAFRYSIEPGFRFHDMGFRVSQVPADK